MTAHLLVSDHAPHVRALLRHRSLLLAKATFVASSPVPSRAQYASRRAPSALVLDARDSLSEWRAFASVSLSTPVLVLSVDERPPPAESAVATVFHATPSSLAQVIPRVLAAIDPTILLIDALLSTRSAPARRSSVELRARRASPARGSIADLADAELDALYLLLSGHSSKEAADRLGITASAFDKRVARMHASVGTSSTHELLVDLFWKTAADLSQHLVDPTTTSRPPHDHPNEAGAESERIGFADDA
jgi:DNA-binding CsgD family transcriptional regulator